MYPVVAAITVSSVVICCVIPGAWGLFVYDCAADGLNVTTLSVLDVEQCPEFHTEDVTTNVEIQVLQQRETYEIQTYRCSVKYRYFMTYGGMHSHISRVHDGEGVGLWNVNQAECMEMHKTRQATILGLKLIDLKLNASDTRVLTIAGYTTSDGYCEGSSLTIGDKHWSKVYATAEVEVILHDFTSTHRISDNVVVTPSGVTCPFKDGYCLNVELGYLCWDTRVRAKCDRTSDLVLYSGRAQKVVITEQTTHSNKYTLYSIKANNFLATLVQQNPLDICGMEMFNTDHSKLIVQEVVHGLRFFSETAIPVKDMDLFLYVNAKFTHVEHHTRHELVSMYTHLMKETCEVKRHSLKTLLSIAMIDPVEFAYSYMGKPGYTALLMGETVNIVQCKPVYATRAVVENCYLELPVNYTGKIYYMTPRSHILQKTGTPVACSPFMRPTYKLENKWFASAGQLVPTRDPSELAINLKPTWTYTDAGELARAGIYSDDDISRLRSQIMYPSERRAISQTISAAVNQDTIITDTQFFKNLITKEALEESVNSFFGSTWSHFQSVGMFFSGIFGIMLVLKLVKIFFDTVINTRGLYEVYGFGWRLMAGVWDAATTYLLSPHRVFRHKEMSPKSAYNPDLPPYTETSEILRPQPENSVSPSSLYPSLTTQPDAPLVTKHSTTSVSPGTKVPRGRSYTALYTKQGPPV